jgi:cell division protein FtsZ
MKKAEKKKKKALKKNKKPKFKTDKKVVLNASLGNINSNIEQGDIIHKTKIRIIGIGGGGSAIVSEIASRIKKADFYIANTDSRSLSEQIKKVKKFQFGINVTKGLGTGMNPELGEAAAMDDKEKIEKMMENQDLCIIVACLGGGTSSGATPIFSKISKDLGSLTYGIFTLPFEFEGRKKMEAALASLEKIKSSLNVYTVMPNERIFEIVDKNTPLKTALSAINKSLADNLEGLIEMIYLPGLVNIDFADLKTILSGRGRLAYINSMDIEEPQKEEAIKKLISSPIYTYTLKGAKGILYNIISGKEIQLSEVAQISNIISESVSKDAKIIFGINQNQKYQNKIKITLLAAGCPGKGFSESPKNERKQIHPAGKKLRKQKVAETKPEKEKPAPVRKKRKNTKKKKVVKIEKPGKKQRKQKEKTVKIKAVAKSKPFIQPIKISPNASVATKIAVSSLANGKIRKNALQLRKETEEAEKEVLDQEKIWEIPAILRKKS